MIKGAGLFVVAWMAFSACATPYQNANPLTIRGGYWDKKGPGQLIKVGFFGNGYITAEKVGVYLVYRCAEVARREGSNYFVMYANLPDAISDRRSTERSVDTIGGKPSSYVYILLCDGPGPQVLSSSEIMERLKPEVASGHKT